MNNRSELDIIVTMIRESYSGAPWHGPSFKMAIDEVDAEMAATKLPDLSHSIWELTSHLQVWIDVFISRLSGASIDNPTRGDFPVQNDLSPEAWAQTLAELDASINNVIQIIESLPDSMLDETTTGKPHPNRPMLIGVAWHTLYHTGQIAMIRRSLERRQSS